MSEIGMISLSEQNKKECEYDQEIPQSHTADQRTALLVEATGQ